jgi:hypothetical protein
MLKLTEYSNQIGIVIVDYCLKLLTAKKQEKPESLFYFFLAIGIVIPMKGIAIKLSICGPKGIQRL